MSATPGQLRGWARQKPLYNLWPSPNKLSLEREVMLLHQCYGVMRDRMQLRLSSVGGGSTSPMAAADNFSTIPQFGRLSKYEDMFFIFSPCWTGCPWSDSLFQIKGWIHRYIFLLSLALPTLKNLPHVPHLPPKVTQPQLTLTPTHHKNVYAEQWVCY